MLMRGVTEIVKEAPCGFGHPVRFYASTLPITRDYPPMRETKTHASAAFHGRKISLKSRNDDGYQNSGSQSPCKTSRATTLLSIGT